MEIRGWSYAVFVGVGISIAAQAAEWPVPPIPAKSAVGLFENAPKPWRDYLAKARAAESIADPLQRCLAFPDLPGNHWPAGHAAAHCRFHAQNDRPALSMDEISGYLMRGERASLNSKLDFYQKRHDAKENSSEEIHSIFEQFGNDDRGDSISSKWLHGSPDDAYANLARGSYLLGKAWRARGKQFVANTPTPNLENMSALVDQAVPLLQKAAALNPRLMPAYIGLMSAAMLMGNVDLAEASFTAAQKQSPACLVLVRQRMQSLLPRWGGSYRQAEDYRLALAPYLIKRPGIALYFSMVYDDEATTLFYDYKASTQKASDFYKPRSKALLDRAVDVGSYDEALHDAGDVALNLVDAPPDDWRGFGLLLQEARFKYGNVWADKMISWRLLKQEPEWALHYLMRAEKLQPTDPELQYMLGAANYNARRYTEAQRHYDAAINDPEQQQASLRESSTMWLYAAGLSQRQSAIKAKPFVDRLTAEYPNDGRGWIYRFDYMWRLGQSIPMEQIKKFLAIADRTDPVQVKAIASFESTLDKGQINK